MGFALGQIGRKTTYFVFFILGILCYGSLTMLANWGALGLFAAIACVIASMYGGGFGTVPAYLADLFGVQYVGAIYGRLLTTWSTAGGPVLVNYLHDSRVAEGVPRDHVHEAIFYALTGLLVVGLIANALIRPVAEMVHSRSERTRAARGQVPDVVIRQPVRRRGRSRLGAGRGSAGLGRLHDLPQRG